MNRKIFTLLASALMLFSTAFYANARRVSDICIGDTVWSLPDGQSVGMYHIRVDYISMPYGVATNVLGVSPADIEYGPYYVATGLTPGAGQTVVTTHSTVKVRATHAALEGGLKYSPTSGWKYEDATNAVGDTMILSVNEGGYVQVISASNLRDSMYNKGKATDAATLTDLQAAMWCTDVNAYGEAGNYPTFKFTNKIFDLDLDWFDENEATHLSSNRGWMYSNSYLNGLLNYNRPFYRNNKSETGNYVVISLDPSFYKWDATGSTGKFVPSSGSAVPALKLYTKTTPTQDFNADTVAGMMYFTITKIAPIILTADEFNSALGSQAKDKLVDLLFFDKNNKKTDFGNNPFAYSLKAETSASKATYSYSGGTYKPADLGYLNIRAYNGKTDLGYIFNSNCMKAADNDKYINDLSTEYIRLRTGLGIDVTLGDTVNTRKPSDNGKNDVNKYHNASYRLIYFPSEDSLVINAFAVFHDNHTTYGTGVYYDEGSDEYLSDAGTTPYYYGLYYGGIHNALIVRVQDLSTAYDGNPHMMTIGHHPSDFRASFGTSCSANVIDAYLVPEGVYTIYDDRGRCLGVRIYNGSYTPQWMELEEGECPDRIPSYQWVIETSEHSKTRINITNREFGDLGQEANNFVAIKNVLVKKGVTQIFKGQGQFIYSPIALAQAANGQYEPITYGRVNGQLLAPVDDPTQCKITDESGFRPVTNAYLTNQYLGYKHFMVNQDPDDVSYGKSEDAGNEKGMDYNAFAFNYLHAYGEDMYISLEPNYSDTLLRVENNATGFQFMLGSYLRNHKYIEENFGYPSLEVFPAHDIYNIVTDEDGQQVGEPTLVYKQEAAPSLKRYYYELKVADFYEFRDQLTSQYVVLKGAKTGDKSDYRNALKYGVADAYSEADPFKFANVYLRETYFLPREATLNEERNPVDPSRRIYYAIMDRIETSQLHTVTGLGLEVSDTLMGADGSSKYNLVVFGVDDKTGLIKAQGKTVSSARVSAFSLENKNYPLYRRLRSTRDDNASPEGDGVNPNAPCQLDAPKTLRIYTENNHAEYLYEDAISKNSYVQSAGQINFLGLNNSAQFPEEVAEDGLVKFNYHLFIDTAYINRGTGWIKPQYLIGVGVQHVAAQTVTGTDNCNEMTTQNIKPYTIGRYLINAQDSAYQVGSHGATGDRLREPKEEAERYITDVDWTRLVFVPAIHVDDRLYIISQLEKSGVAYKIQADDEEWYVSDSLLRLAADKGQLKARSWDNSSAYGDYYDFNDWNNYHNDVCFSLRFAQPNVENPDASGEDTYSNYDKRFLIESETTNRQPYGNRKIAPVQGGWVKIQNGVPVMSRGSYEDAIQQSEIFNVEKPTEWQNGEATNNEAVATKVAVVGGDGEVTIMNAAGKNVTITNILGQVVANTALASDKATVKVSKGVVVVAIDGEKAVKTIVK